MRYNFISGKACRTFRTFAFFLQFHYFTKGNCFDVRAKKIQRHITQVIYSVIRVNVRGQYKSLNCVTSANKKPVLANRQPMYRFTVPCESAKQKTNVPRKRFLNVSFYLNLIYYVCLNTTKMFVLFRFQNILTLPLYFSYFSLYYSLFLSITLLFYILYFSILFVFISLLFKFRRNYSILSYQEKYMSIIIIIIAIISSSTYSLQKNNSVIVIVILLNGTVNIQLKKEKIQLSFQSICCVGPWSQCSSEADIAVPFGALTDCQFCRLTFVAYCTVFSTSKV